VSLEDKQISIPDGRDLSIEIFIGQSGYGYAWPQGDLIIVGDDVRRVEPRKKRQDAIELGSTCRSQLQLKRQKTAALQDAYATFLP
jgi:hypothetical protein